MSSSLLPIAFDEEALLNLISKDKELLKAINLFAEEGHQYLENIIGCLYPYRSFMPFEIQMGLFAIVGRYIHTFSSLIRNGDYHFSTAHNMAVMDVLSDSRVTEYIESMLKNMVTQTVGAFMGEDF